ncbi:MAG: ATP-dependent metallopeptidase FtsH/Yme1/Tma family protein, partial [Longispora sp.]|nr:ATP-dependent metallopeptidase FtsH/Yme1/Tma family protein [Longispora sp. (in: high G+C Gram-positive bacteria)]
MERTRIFRKPWFWVILVIGAAILMTGLFSGGGDYKKIKTSEAVTLLGGDSVKRAVMQDKEQILQLELREAQAFDKVEKSTKVEAQYPADASEQIYNQLVSQQKAGKIEQFNAEVTQNSTLGSILLSLLPLALIVLLLLFFMSQMQGGGSRVLSFGKSKAKLISKDTPKTTFADVAGADEAVEELYE